MEERKCICICSAVSEKRKKVKSILGLCPSKQSGLFFYPFDFFVGLTFHKQIFFPLSIPANIGFSLFFLLKYKTGKQLNLLPVCRNRDPYSFPCPPLQWRVTMIINLTRGLPIKILVGTQKRVTLGVILRSS